MFRRLYTNNVPAADYLVLLPDKREWRVVSLPSGADPFLFHHYISSEGDVWVLYWDDDAGPATVAKYRQETNAFDIVGQFSLPKISRYLIGFDANSQVFYFFMPDGEVNAYSLGTQELTQQAYSHNSRVVTIAWAKDGFYLLDFGGSPWLTRGQLRYFSVEDNSVSVITGSFVPVPGNAFTDQVSGSLFVDSAEGLWMGIYARYASGRWNVTHPNQLAYLFSDFRMPNFGFGSPHIVAELGGLVSCSASLGP